MDEARTTVLVIGATGSIGRHVVTLALAHGYGVRALARDPGKACMLPRGVEIAVGDLTRTETLSKAVAGVDAIVFTHGTYGNPKAAASVDYGAVRNVLAALAGSKVRIALMSTIGATDRRGSHDWKRRGERLVRASGNPYTIVRPAWFDHNGPDENRLLMLQGDKPLTGSPADGVIARRQIAEVLIRSLRSEAALRKTFELHAERGAEQPDFDPVFAALEADEAGVIDGARDASNMPLDQEPRKVLDDLQELQARHEAKDSSAAQLIRPANHR